MLFSSKKFSRRTWREHGKIICTAFVLFFFIISAEGRKATRFSNDFENFLSELGTMVYNWKPEKREPPPVQLPTTTTTENYRRSDNIRNTQKQALGDVLMMKLVSYYEDKYKLNVEPHTTQKVSYTQQDENRHNEIDRSDFQALSYNGNRRLSAQNTRMQYDDLPEVVVL